MKRITALIISLAMLISSVVVCADTGSGISVDEIKVAFSENATSSNGITITGKYDKSLTLRVFNEKDVLIYIDTTSSNNGSFEFSTFKLGKPESVGSANNDYRLNYKFVISGDNNDITTESVDFIYTVKNNNNNTSDSDSGAGKTEAKKTEGWTGDHSIKQEEKIEEPSGPSHIDTLNTKVIEAAASVSTEKEAQKFIENTTKATAEQALGWESVRNTVAVSVETMVSNISAKKIKPLSSNNTITLNRDSVSDAELNKYASLNQSMMDSLQKNNITLNRDINKEYVITTAFSTSKKAGIVVRKDFVEKIEKVGIDTVTISDKNFRVSYSTNELKDALGEQDSTKMEIDANAISTKNKKVLINFDTNKTDTVKISFPGLSGDTKYMAIIDENGNAVGGRYNPATGALEAKIADSGIYEIVENEKNFDDIKGKSEEMQESIKILASKGIISGTSEKEFSPDGTITRAEVAALLLRVLSQVDPNADGGFVDVKKTDWFYGTAGSSKRYGLIKGFDDNTFRGNDVIAKDQILTVSSRVLQKEMRYKIPSDTSEWLKYKDSDQIEDWAKNDIALATMANIVTKSQNNKISASAEMTRGDAALIIMRLFYKIW